jgi:hypothetical protein
LRELKKPVPARGGDAAAEPGDRLAQGKFRRRAWSAAAAVPAFGDVAFIEGDEHVDR